MEPEYTNIVYGNSMMYSANTQLQQNVPLVQTSDSENITNMESSMNTPLESENLLLETENLKNQTDNACSNNENEFRSHADEELAQIDAYRGDNISDNHDDREETDTGVRETPMEVENPPENTIESASEPVESAAGVAGITENKNESEEMKTAVEKIEKTEIAPEPETPAPVISERVSEHRKRISKPKAEPNSTDICRVCLQPGKLINIFNKDGGLKVSDKVMSCAAVQISKGDGLPPKICQPCIDKVHIAYDFKVTCEGSDIELRKRFLKNSKTPKTVVKTEFVLIECDQDYDLDDSDSDRPLWPPKRKYKEESEEISESNEDTGSDTSFLIGGKKKSKKTKKKRSLPKRLLPKRLKHDKKKKNSRKSEENYIAKPSEAEDRIIIKKVKSGNESMSPASETKNKHACSQCKRTFPYPSFLKQHMLTHTKDKILKCKFCTATFTNSNVLQKHNTDFHAEDYDEDIPEIIKEESKAEKVERNRSHKCQYCDKEFSSANLLKAHKKVHVGEKPFICKICNKAFKQTVSLEAHVKRHSEEKTLRCDMCDTYCLTKVELKRHISTAHAEERPFECETCQKSFVSKQRLEKHQQRHEREEQEANAKNEEKKKTPSTKDLFKSIAPITSTYWSDSYSD